MYPCLSVGMKQVLYSQYRIGWSVNLVENLRTCSVNVNNVYVNNVGIKDFTSTVCIVLGHINEVHLM